MNNPIEYIVNMAKEAAGCYAILNDGGEILAEYNSDVAAIEALEYYEQYGATQVKFIEY